VALEAPDAALAELIAEYDSRWGRLDFEGLSQLWVRSDPEPVYLGDEYAEPLIGAVDLDRHWARLSARIRQASMRSTLHRVDVLDGEVARCVLLCRWTLSTRGVGGLGEGASWVTWLVVPGVGRYLIALHMESEVHVPPDGTPG
jgi:hypothetical protein